MQRVGTVSGTAQNLVIARAEGDSRPDIGRDVVDESLSSVGRVVDIFGPVERPYVAVAPNEGTSPASLVGKKLYAR